MAKKRKKRNQPKDVDLLEPLDLTKIGNDDDPCFGKLFDLSTSECKMCGDQARCAIVFSQKLNINRKKIEKENRFKDMELVNDQKIIDYIESKINKGLKRARVIKFCNKKFGKDSKKYREIYNKVYADI